MNSILSLAHQHKLITTTQANFHANKRGNPCFLTTFFHYSEKGYKDLRERLYEGDEFAEWVGSLHLEITSDDVLNNRDNCVMQFRLNDSLRRLVILHNHYYIGGCMMNETIAFVINRPPMKLPDSDILKSACYLPLCLWDLSFYDTTPAKPRKMVEINQNYYAKYDVPWKDNKRFELVRLICSKVSHMLRLRRPLRIMLTVAMNRIDYVDNNVGMIPLTIKPTDTADDIKRQALRFAYMGLVTNSLTVMNAPFAGFGHSQFRRLLAYHV